MLKQLLPGFVSPDRGVPCGQELCFDHGWGSSTVPGAWCVCVFSRSVVSNSVTPWTLGSQVPLSIGFLRQEYWSRLFLTQGSNQGLLCFMHWQEDSLPLALPGKPVHGR